MILRILSIDKYFFLLDKLSICFMLTSLYTPPWKEMNMGRKFSLVYASLYASAPVREGFQRDEFGSKSGV
jgi:hypothetical protein